MAPSRLPVYPANLQVSTSTIPIVMLIPRPRKQMNIAGGWRFSCQQVGAQQLGVYRRRECEPDERGLHGIGRSLGIVADAPTAAERCIPDRDDSPAQLCLTTA
jgi:hypothetical protein